MPGDKVSARDLEPTGIYQSCESEFSTSYLSSNTSRDKQTVQNAHLQRPTNPSLHIYKTLHPNNPWRRITLWDIAGTSPSNKPSPIFSHPTSDPPFPIPPSSQAQPQSPESRIQTIEKTSLLYSYRTYRRGQLRNSRRAAWGGTV
ncbi:hypothetical protein HBH98_184180 [Parastagonospora nodorum]|nr:hypothetical protein HBH53_183770 [Parastagonospora nodorum]KAH3964085.1 hypothetical protein HBH51_162060 [Parastagonospora nodorum]KAH3997433.1 hypothetical protein HBI10_142980 [Parastagonospora nodorum]KAH4021087.1 hypothetical protein HBI13_111280 [Parastagonospora nodorum]KAH4037130.1 hypothetical protein HBI09_066390 [Parastagonospora nodorum]